MSLVREDGLLEVLFGTIGGMVGEACRDGRVDPSHDNISGNKTSTTSLNTRLYMHRSCEHD